MTTKADLLGLPGESESDDTNSAKNSEKGRRRADFLGIGSSDQKTAVTKDAPAWAQELAASVQRITSAVEQYEDQIEELRAETESKAAEKSMGAAKADLLHFPERGEE